MRLQRFDRTTLTATPWKNGGGMTREVVCWPPGASLDTFHWRVSIATIARDGPFSAFPGIDRVITLLEGGGVHLTSDDGRIDHRLDTPMQPYAFAGEASVHARLLADVCEDFNVMARRAACRAQVRVVRQAGEVSAPQGLLLVTQGVWSAQIAGQDAQSLPVPHGLWWDGAMAAWQLHPRTPEATLLAVTIEPAPETP